MSLEETYCDAVSKNFLSGIQRILEDMIPGCEVSKIAYCATWIVDMIDIPSNHPETVHGCMHTLSTRLTSK